MQAELNYLRYYPATINTAAEAALAFDAATAIGLQAAVAPRAAFTSEDFAFMLQRSPGAYLWLGQGRADPGRTANARCTILATTSTTMCCPWACAGSARWRSVHWRRETGRQYFE